jgi:hypothetical protein
MGEERTTSDFVAETELEDLLEARRDEGRMDLAEQIPLRRPDIHLILHGLDRGEPLRGLHERGTALSGAGRSFRANRRRAPAVIGAAGPGIVSAHGREPGWTPGPASNSILGEPGVRLKLSLRKATQRAPNRSPS